MSTQENSARPRSLTQHFEAPADLPGLFGWVCGYSADADFMNEAVERFTRQSEGQRAYLGKAALALLLDPGNPYLTFPAVPGVVHLGLRKLAEKPFVLMHAKVAILGFQHSGDTSQWVLRLVVSTGNWTRQTLESSLDLAWSVEVSSDDLAEKDGATRQACADIKAAAEMFEWLKPNFDTRILGAGGELATSPSGLFDSLLTKVTSKAGRAKPRFFSSIKASLSSQLPGLVNRTGLTSAGAAIKRNYLAMGSGFYEMPPKENPEIGKPNEKTPAEDLLPIVLRDIVAGLRKSQLITEQVEMDVFVNRDSCQALTRCLPWFEAQKITVREARAPEKLFGNAKRDLHAKFIFSATWRTGSPLCVNAWLYMGSGNLTHQGFLNKATKRGGNLEAGVVFAPAGIHWAPMKGKNTNPLITDLLPLQWDTYLSARDELKEGGGMEEREYQYIAAPVAWLHWRERQTGPYLQIPEGATVVFAVLDDGGTAHSADEQGRVLWSSGRPREVTLVWAHEGSDHQALVPVLDEFGRIAGAALPKLALDQAWWQLANFPLPPDEDDLVDEKGDAEAPVSLVTPPHMARATGAASYPIRQMMELIENIADKQTQLTQSDWLAWCTRLEECLLQAAESPALGEFSKLEINPLSPLWSAPFRPYFAENNHTPEGQRYEAILQRVERAWAVTSLNKLGASHAQVI